jgi:hypothetical protein
MLNYQFLRFLEGWRIKEISKTSTKEGFRLVLEDLQGFLLGVNFDLFQDDPDTISISVDED